MDRQEQLEKRLKRGIFPYMWDVFILILYDIKENALEALVFFISVIAIILFPISLSVLGYIHMKKDRKCLKEVIKYKKMQEDRRRNGEL